MKEGMAEQQGKSSIAALFQSWAINKIPLLPKAVQNAPFILSQKKVI